MIAVKPLRLLLLLCCLSPGIRGEDALSLFALELAQPGEVLLPGQNDGEWRELLTQLAEKGAVFATFTEHRWFSFRHDPVVLIGEMRLSPARGLSLRYLKPDEKMMIVDESGVVLRNARGRSRALKPDPDAPNSAAALLRVMRFDLEDLVKDFEVSAARQGEEWRFDFMPREVDLAKRAGLITVWGRGVEVTNLEMEPTKGPRIEITINATRDRVTFTAEEQRRYFR